VPERSGPEGATKGDGSVPMKKKQGKPRGTISPKAYFLGEVQLGRGAGVKLPLQRSVRQEKEKLKVGTNRKKGGYVKTKQSGKPSPREGVYTLHDVFFLGGLG